MYNKIFTKILDSSIWLEPDATRIVWLTCIAAMDEDGFCAFASPANLAHRANVTLTAALAALETLEGPDANSSDHDNEGRRLERVPGGWMVLNAAKYRELVSRELAKLGNRRRVQRHRESKRSGNGALTQANELVTLSEAEADTKTRSDTHIDPERAFTDGTVTERAGRFIERYEALYVQHRNARYLVRPDRDYQAAVPLCATWTDDARLDKLAAIFLTTDNDFAVKGSRTIPQFAALASWCDGQLSAWETKQNAGTNVR